MPKLKPWHKWYPQDWLSDPGLAMCDAATRGIWADAVNFMLLQGVSTISGTEEQLSRLLRCRTVQLQAALCDLKQHEVAKCTMQNGCIIIECRRLRRELDITHLRAGAANARWCKGDANDHAKPMQTGYRPEMQTPMQTSVSVSASVSASTSEEGGVGEEVELPAGFPKSITEAEVQAEFVGCPKEFAGKVWNKARYRNGVDSKDRIIRSFRHYLQTEWSYEQERANSKSHVKVFPQFQLREIEDQISKHPCNRNNVAHNPKADELTKSAYRRLLDKRDELRKAIVSAPTK